MSDVSLHLKLFILRYLEILDWYSDLGEIRELECANCGEVERYFFGVGQQSFEISLALMQGDLDMLRRNVSDKLFEQVTEIIKDEPDEIGFHVTKGNFACKSCNTAFYMKQLKVSGLAKGEWVETLACPVCQDELKLTKKRLGSFSCKSCGEPSLQETRVGLWD